VADLAPRPPGTVAIFPRKTKQTLSGSEHSNYLSLIRPHIEDKLRLPPARTARHITVQLRGLGYPFLLGPAAPICGTVAARADYNLARDAV
jgi:hypothetical protein